MVYPPLLERKDPMSEHFIYSISSFGGEPPVGAASLMEGRRAQAEQVKASSDKKKMSSFPGNTRLIFEVDKQDHSVVVMIVDEASSQVIRTIPGDAIDDMPSGGLIHKNA